MLLTPPPHANAPTLTPRTPQITTSGYAVQCRITTEDPVRNFTPDSGVLSVYRSATGKGIRIDGAWGMRLRWGCSGATVGLQKEHRSTALYFP